MTLDGPRLVQRFSSLARVRSPAGGSVGPCSGLVARHSETLNRGARAGTADSTFVNSPSATSAARLRAYVLRAR
jgi:hypothetical protein